MENKELKANEYEVIGFQHSCLLFETINEEELQTNLERLIVQCEDTELLIAYSDLIGCGEDRFSLIKTFRERYHGDWDVGLTEKQLDALTGIAYKRGIIPYEHTSGLERKAKKALKSHPEVERLFRKVFPFIDF
ncbi:hypothetical protein [Halodesulfovibrio spirochaetisodalis]|uniref:Uncharacterized protein n=1 Tax=Halodesulfovibrio spirochaetisodalis TaxID=1560234 RepID=A0A1B7XAS9_9BACT|nr:hypothetical protein [Halodesulfovibrio spirochaetisodalis]OBQ46483.1 hypothetical protein SP90_12350 [Halodesulfovibrio spirochaetisodalis]